MKVLSEICKKSGLIRIGGLALLSTFTIAAGSEEEASGRSPNRLFNQTSPYLLQHAYNPVDWYPWGEEAFSKARAEGKMIFLSIGYSTCHWCHVMERESFNDPEIASLMNEHLVSIKVDREERPDIDRVYMQFVQATTGSGGWPLNVWLTPDLKPVVGGTYFPPASMRGRPGFPDMVGRIAKMWKENRDELDAQSSEIIKYLETALNATDVERTELSPEILAGTFRQVSAAFDPEEGGFSPQPKFPRPVTLAFLFHYSDWKESASKEGKKAREMALFTLRKMARGGVHDHLGGGFHRYSVDRWWHVPHFEKMLYDQAQLANAYLDAYQITEDVLYAETATDILEYVIRDLSRPAGGFFSAEDADSIADAGGKEKREGAFYIWKKEEISKLLDEEEARVFNHRYGVESIGNVSRESDPHHEFIGYNVLIERASLYESAKHAGLPPERAAEVLASAKRKLLFARQKRHRPALDDKVITAWNGLMISAYARASQILREPKYLYRAERAAAFIESNLYRPESATLFRSYRVGPSDIPGFCQDYAFLIHGLLDLYESSLDFHWLDLAIKLQNSQDSQFLDQERGGYFADTGTDPSILLRLKDSYDGSEPSPNSIAALNLFRLAEMTGIASYNQNGERTLKAFSKTLSQAPFSMPQLVVAFDFFRDSTKQIIIAGDREDQQTLRMLQEVYRHYIPNKIILLADGGVGQKFLRKNLEIFESIAPIDGLTTAFVCENYVCQLPTNDLTVLAGLLVRRSHRFPDSGETASEKL